MRLDKFIAQQLSVNRAIARHETRGSCVIVDDDIVKDVSFKLQPEYEVEYDGNTLTQQNGPRYFVLNKPQGYVCSTDDLDHPAILYFLGEPVAHRLHITGYLDIDTTGLVLVTDDGQWSHRITSSRHHYEKTCLVELESLLTEGAVELFTKGVQLRNERGLTKPAVLGVIAPTEVRLTISEEHYHQVRRMFVAVGNRVVGLYRERTDDILLDDALAPGEHHSLTETETVSVGAPQARNKT